MTKQLLKQDLENLSAYLDGELTSQEQTRLEQSLGQRSDLRQALEDLRQTRVILHSASRLRAPRNFTLTPAMVGMQKPAHKPFFAFTALRFSSALATILLVLSVVGEWIAFSGPVAAPVAMLNEPTAVAESQLPQEPPEAALLAAPTSEPAAGLREGAPEEPAIKGFGTPQPTPTPTSELMAAQPALETPEGDSATMENPMLGNAMVAETATPEVMLVEPLVLPAETPTIEAFGAGGAATSEMEQALDQSAPTNEAAAGTGEAVAMEPAVEEAEVNPHLAWRFVQIFWLILALVSAAGVLILRQLDRTRNQ